jgi:hypothetical protein
MKTILLYLISFATVSYAFYLRNDLGSAGIFSILSIPAMFYLMVTSSYIVIDFKNKGKIK